MQLFLLLVLGCGVTADPVDVDGDGVPASDDCDDFDPGVAGNSTWYADEDDDGYGDMAVTAIACRRPLGHVADATDCDDDDPTISPGATEVCDTYDNDCDGSVDEGLTTAYHVDKDNDSFGDRATPPVEFCEQPSRYVVDASDCDDADWYVNPDAMEVVGDGVDSDCDGSDGWPIVCADDPSEADLTIVGTDSVRFGTDVAGIGDEDGDGKDDLLVATLNDFEVVSSAGTYTYGRVYLLNASALQEVSTWDDFPGVGAGEVAGGLGDVHGDGTPDYLYAEPDLPTPQEGYSADNDLGIVGGALEASGTFRGYSAGTALPTLGDVDGDGLRDAAVVVSGITQIIYAPFSTDVYWVPDTYSLDTVTLIGGTYAVGDGDHDGDGRVDIVASYATTGGLGVISAPPLGIPEREDYYAIYSAEATEHQVGWIDGHDLVDLTGDGYDDLVVLAPRYDSGGVAPGAMYLLSGPLPEGEHTLSSSLATATWTGTGDAIGVMHVARAGDVNGDGFDDVLLGGNLILGPRAAGTYGADDFDYTFLAPDSGPHLIPASGGAGDLDGDGLDDMAFGDPYESGGTDLHPGALYILLAACR